MVAFLFKSISNTKTITPLVCCPFTYFFCFFCHFLQSKFIWIIWGILYSLSSHLQYGYSGFTKPPASQISPMVLQKTGSLVLRQYFSGLLFLRADDIYEDCHTCTNSGIFISRFFIGSIM